MKTKNKAHPPGPDLRSWLATLESHGELKRITTEVDWDQEIGAIARINLGLQGPGLLFENIKGYQNTRCTKFLTGSLGNRRHVCLLLGLPLDTPDRQIVAHLKRNYRHGIAPVEVETGPVKTHRLVGSDLDLTRFPRTLLASP
ncbi:MAG: UbiD family decarboxylase [Rhodocyclaceae bacterium]|nr:UbiD family decarboxylase [Rhodocyclaceae bacterium]